MALSNGTIQGSIDLGTRITVYCHNSACHHRGELDMLKLRDKLGPDHGALHDDLAPKLRCSKCGGKKVGLICTPAGNDRLVPGNAYQKAREGR